MHSFLGKRGDSYDRFLIRVREMYESVNIVFQILTNLTNKRTNLTSDNNKNIDFFSFFEFLYKSKKTQLNKKTKYTSMENLISHFKKYSEGTKVPKGFSYAAVEAPKGEFGVSLISDGTSKPYRCKIRTPAYHNMHIFPRMVQGHYVADLVTVIGSQDIVFGDVDR
jgi:NADH-quinone oxidoreductase subunit D